MNNLDKQYINILEDILENGVKKSDRTGTGTLSVFSREIRHKMSDGFPILTTKKVHFKGVIEELLWFINGDTNIKPLVDKGVNIWVGDCYKKYIKECREEMSKEDFIESIKQDKNVFTGETGFSKKYGDIGPGYGKQWRKWNISNKVNPNTGEFFLGNSYIDQISNLINDLKNNPDSRRLLVSAWNVSELSEMTLPPCHFAFQCYTRELTYSERYRYWFNHNYENGFVYYETMKVNFDSDLWVPTPTRALSLKWYQRSVDFPLGLPFNIASYGLLLELLAKEVGMIPDELIGSLGDCHIYTNQIDGVKEQIKRAPYLLPSFFVKPNPVNFDIFNISSDDLVLIGYESHPSIKFPLSN